MAQQPSRGGVQPQNRPLQQQSTQQPALTEPTVAAPVMVPGAGQVTGVSVSQHPRSLDGQELAAVLVWKVAAALAQQLSVNGRLSAITAFGKHKIRFQVWAEVVDPSDPSDKIILQAAKEEILELDQAQIDYLRAEAGIGLWHEGRSMQTGTVVEFKQQPTQQVLQHLKKLGPVLVKEEGQGLSGLDLMISGLGR